MENEIDWFSSVEGEIEGITLKNFEEMCAAGFELRAKISQMESDLKNEEARLQILKNNITAVLDRFGKSKQDTAKGLVYISEKLSVAHPKETEDRQKFFDWLKAKGIFDTIISVNSMTLNKIYKEEREISIEEGRTDFSIPGIGQPVLLRTINFKKGK